MTRPLTSRKTAAALPIISPLIRSKIQSTGIPTLLSISADPV